VENEHVYRVGLAGILVHNTCPTPKELFEAGLFPETAYRLEGFTINSRSKEV
jgi:hypothetical protein